MTMSRRDVYGLLGASLIGMLFVGWCAGLWFIGSRTNRMLVESSREHFVHRLDAAQQPNPVKRRAIAKLDKVIAAHRRGELEKARLMRIFDRLSQIRVDSPNLLEQVERAIAAERDRPTSRRPGLAPSAPPPD